MKFSGKMCLMIIFKITKNQGFTLCLADTIFKIPQGGWVRLTSAPLPAVLGLSNLVHDFWEDCFYKAKLLSAANRLIYLNILISILKIHSPRTPRAPWIFTQHNPLLRNYLNVFISMRQALRK